MRCREARKILEQEVEGVDTPRSRDDIRAHLASCTACAQFAKELRLTWDLLDILPEIPVSETFNRNVIARVRQEDMGRDSGWTLGRVMGWQWMTVAASVLVLAIVLIPGLVDRQPVQGISSTDQWDDSFLQDLDISLDRSETSYLPAYDAWADENASGQNSPSDSGGVQENPGGVRHGKS